MQVNSSWYGVLGHERWMSLANPCECTKAGAEILKKCIDAYGLTWRAVGCYNARSEDKREKYARKINNALIRIREKRKERAIQVASSNYDNVAQGN